MGTHHETIKQDTSRGSPKGKDRAGKDQGCRNGVYEQVKEFLK